MSDVPEFVGYSSLSFAASQQQTNNLLDDPNLASAIKKQVELQLPILMVPIVKIIGESFLSTLAPMMENLVRKIVKEQLEKAQEKLFTREKGMSGNETQTSELRYLQLKFLDSVCLPVYTGKEIKGEGGKSIRVALLDSDGNPVNSGPEASSKVEIMVLSEDIDNGDNSSKSGESGSCTKKSEKQLSRPFLSKNRLKLKEGIAVLDGFKFKNKAKWTKSCEIRLVAKMIGNIRGTTVKEAKTESFLVRDCRCILYRKHSQPLLADELWRLKMIRRGGELHKRLLKLNITSVEEFLISHNMDSESLQKRLGIGAEKFKAIVNHAKTAEVAGNLYKYYSPGCGTNVAVGCVQGLLHEHQRFVHVDDLDEDGKVGAHNMVVSAFENTKDVQSYDNEASAASDFPPQVSNDVNTSILPRLGSPSDFNFDAYGTIDELGLLASSRVMSPISDNWCQEICRDIMNFLGPGSNYSDNLQSCNPDDYLQSANPRIEAHDVQSTGAIFCEGSSASVLSSRNAKGRWRMMVMSLRKRIIAPGDNHTRKKQRHC